MMRELHAQRLYRNWIGRTSSNCLRTLLMPCGCLILPRPPPCWLPPFPRLFHGRHETGLVQNLGHIPLRAELKTVALIVALLALGKDTLRGQFTITNYFNWETSPVHPLALSPDGTRMAVCNLPDNRLEVFDVTSGKPVPLGG